MNGAALRAATAAVIGAQHKLSEDEARAAAVAAVAAASPYICAGERDRILRTEGGGEVAGQLPTGREMRGAEITVAVTCCTGCGCLVGKDDEDWERHMNWHRLLRNLTTGETTEGEATDGAVA